MADNKANGKKDDRSPKSRRERRMIAKTCWWAGPVSAALAVVLAVIGLYCAERVNGYAAFRSMRAQVDRSTFYPGLTIDGVDVSDMDYNRALSYFQAIDEQQRSAYFVKLRFDEQEWVLEADAFGYQSDYREILDNAWSVGRYGSLEERYAVVSRAAGDWARDYAISRSIDRAKLLDTLSPIAVSLTQVGSDAQVSGFSTANLEFTFKEGSVGYVVDPQKLLDQVLQKIDEGGGTLEIVRDQVDPPTTAAELAKQFGKITTATTNASFSNSNRLTNLKLACKALNGVVVQPGETFSFNKTLGERTTKKGYKAAGALENGLTTEQVGGGICQVSTTLFNAVAKADMKITERSPHSRPSSYIDLGKDAAVNWPNQDFRFKNTSAYPVYIVASLTKDKKVTISVYGKKLEDGKTIKIVSKKVATYNPGSERIIADPSLLPGERVVVEKARKGYKAETYRVYYDANGNEIDRQGLFKSTYKAAGAVVRVGE